MTAALATKLPQHRYDCGLFWFVVRSVCFLLFSSRLPWVVLWELGWRWWQLGSGMIPCDWPEIGKAQLCANIQVFLPLAIIWLTLCCWTHPSLTLFSPTEQVLSYIKSLEARVLLLEAEKQQLSEVLKPSRFHPEGAGGESGEVAPPPPPPHPRPLHPPPYSLSHHLRAVGLGLTHRAPLGPGEYLVVMVVVLGFTDSWW